MSDHALGTDPSVDDVRRLDEGAILPRGGVLTFPLVGVPFLVLRTVSSAVRVAAVRTVASAVVRATGDEGGRCRSERRDERASGGCVP
ncbi:hypothetical protein BRD03_02570 [Halobacteriales archaeon QS_9_68_17]|nr:MAG: hypothetical protein BRD03_02570 [Halobacteriales archaeon QS_9_68_17]